MEMCNHKTRGLLLPKPCTEQYKLYLLQFACIKFILSHKLPRTEVLGKSSS